MKIRIKGNSVRLRLSRIEVAAFAEQGYISEETHFGNAVLTYALQRINGDKMTAKLEDHTITMLLPEAMATQWTDTEKVGFDANMDIGDGNELYLLLEKDFQCLDNSIEDQSDNYENPLAAQLKK